ncbi:gamma-tubulin complex component 2-like isoform X2 [Argiope bruennichi]|uniref:Gamma-tubulin complex component n=1 Tax=Argiope bruennichi TaxID=94029 RepID=A0A8T0FQY3_ARGBR|nr:gamma-tubulin complex component 2-like isoform X2 [Argiope bruennichi]KAF8792059.1 Gamma-tubulin complex component 2 like protein [Argiope bruennichi]
MSEYTVHHLVSELINNLGFTEKLSEGASCEDYAEILKKSRTPYNTKCANVTAIKKVSESSSCPEEFMKRYEEIKLKQIREVDSLVSFLYKVQNDEKVKNLLVKNSSAKINSSTVSNEKSSINSNLSHRDAQFQKKSNSIKSEHEGLRKEPPPRVPPGIYALPNWVKHRKNLSWNFVDDVLPNPKHCGPIGALPPNVQESRLIDDILFCLVGIDGDYVYSKKVDGDKRIFLVDESANIALKLLVQNMMPMFSHYSTIINFIEKNIHYEQGLVNHALAAAMRIFLKDYFVLVSQLENQHIQRNLTLQKMWFYLQPSLATMETIADIASILNEGECFGGTVLSVLHDNTASLTGSSKSREICHTLTRAASLPYFEFLEKWIYKGIISDYYSEFLVEDNELIKKEDLPTEYSDAYWEKRYTIRFHQIPVFLSKAADMILRTGKYLNVIRQCGKPVNCPDAKAIVYTTRESQYVEYIEPAYHFASKKLLDVLMDDADLKRRLLSVKHYFLLDQGDFIVQFMDMAEEELQKDIDDIMPSRLESLLELALRTSVVNEDKYKDDVRVELLPYDLLTQMFKILQIPTDVQNEYRNTESMMLTGLEAFVFDYEVKWPLSLVINRKALAYYQILFRHLFYCKHIERLLGRVWSLNKRTKSLPRSEMCHYASAFALRQRMFNFIQNLDYYLTLEVIEPHWNDFFRKISQVTNVDEVLFCHNDFLEKCVEDCMLANPKLFQVLATLMTLCADFSIFLQGIMKCSMDMDMSAAGDSLLYSVREQPLLDMASCPAALENFQQQVSSYEKKFDQSIICMLHILHSVHQSKQTSKIINMLYRLDFSRFYEEISLKKMGNEDDV